MLNPLPDLLAKAFAAYNGQLSFGQYMALSNQCYYAQDTVIGRNGDFITAPEISQLFGEMLGIWVVQQWHNLGQPAQWQLLELGPGRGTLMADVLRVVLKFVPRHSIQLYAVETSPTLRQQQAAAWANYPLSPQWADDIQYIPPGPSITLANEFLDALPVEQYQWDGESWLQRMVISSPLNGEVSLGLARLGGGETGSDNYHPHQHSLNSLRSLRECNLPLQGGGIPHQVGDIYESPAQRHQALAPLAVKLNEQPGAALFIDYGFSEYAFGDTVQAVKNHQPVDILAHPGTADLTSHINFAALRDWATAQGLKASAIITQSDLLHRLGIAERLQALQAKADMPSNLALLNGYQRLTAPSQMGVLFKTLAITSS